MNKFLSYILDLYTERKKRVNAPRRIVISFALVILIGALLLMCPISSSNGETTSFLGALFTAASATCVTGLVVFETGEYFSLFGQVVILILIQIGGLGFMTILVMAVIHGRKNMNIRNKMIIAQSLSVESMSNASVAARLALRLTMICEGAGAIILSFRFIPQYGIKGIWYGVFHSVSAFCNAGFDVLGRGNSICDYSGDPIVMLVLAFLIISGGLGVLVFNDIHKKRIFKRFALYTKLVLSITAVLLVFGTVAFFVLEHNNPDTIGNFALWKQWLNAFFQAVTCRTAGFDSIGQAHMTEQSKLVSVLLMMIGGASGSTAGGIKVVTVGVIFFSVISSLQARENVVVWGRHIRHSVINNAMLLLVMWFMLVMGAALFVSFYDNFSLIDALYEVTSAYGTAGLSVGVTGSASSVVKILLILYMFFGRVGIMTISVTFATRKRVEDKIQYPEGKVIIG